MTGDQIPLFQLPGIERNGKLEALEKGISALKAFAGSVEKAVIPVEDPFQTPGESVGTVAQLLFDIVNGKVSGKEAIISSISL